MQTSLSVFGQDSIAYREQHLQEIVVKAPHFTIEDDHIMCIPSTQQRKHAHTGYDVLNSMMTSFSLFKQLALSVAVTVFTSRRLVKNYLNPKRIFYSIELMVQMLLILSISGARSSHRRTRHVSLWMLMALCNFFSKFSEDVP